MSYRRVLIDITGQKFKRLTVIARHPENKRGHAMWVCGCDCGNTIIASGADLRGNHRTSCGCLTLEGIGKKLVIDRVGQIFGRLTVISRKGRGKHGHAIWGCKCICGNEIDVSSISLVRKNTTSCGCRGEEIKETFKTIRLTHGATRNGGNTRTYRIWQGMKSRCTYPSMTQYKDYGGRGIKVCDRWLNSFENFLSDMGEAPENLQIDRIDNNGNYEPKNCRWVTASENCINRIR